MSSNRITTAFGNARAQGKKLLCPFFTAGYPSVEASVDLLVAAQEAGCGIIELGVPFSDPIADGPVIQASYTHALSHGVTVEKALNVALEARKRGVNTPILAMVSFSIIFKRGTDEFAKVCVEKGIDGLILPDVPLEEAPAIVEALGKRGLLSSLLVAPTTPAQRRAEIIKLCTGFIYYLSVTGITGERRDLPADMAQNLEEIKRLSSTPVCVGFGISTQSHVRQVCALADGAIVGSAIIRKIADYLDKPGMVEAVGGQLRDLVLGTHT